MPRGNVLAKYYRAGVVTWFQFPENVTLHSLQVLGIIHAIHAVAVFLKVMAPSLYHPRYKAHEMWSIVVLNSFSLAIACRSAGPAVAITSKPWLASIHF